jgi:hypothetical protein
MIIIGKDIFSYKMEDLSVEWDLELITSFNTLLKKGIMKIAITV